MEAGFKIIEKVPTLPKELIDAYLDLPTSNIADVMWRVNSIGGEIKAIHKNGMKLLGRAITAKVPPTDNLMMHKAIELASPGDVIVVDAGGTLSHATTGEIMSRYAKKKGIRGFVINGAVRDADGINSLQFPVYAKGLQPRGPYKNGPGEVNVPVTCGDVVVHPGDLVIGDLDGVVIVPNQFVEEVARKTIEKSQAEERIFEQIENESLDQSWIDQVLIQKGIKKELTINKTQ
ncbi:RraA family protein [Alkalihalobacillus oceani]|uniref:Putative 4-hydroxy-4-methyl-2-oxoglutarate aldolase n=1 Tax=Halalkalibacter oceani TaxID=1653776 RepID=A0A9X2DP41_9BACI|nr:RraA family protein [Halalkalibacter oceani]MCM3714329.1 RraA family protein [Halalkalibacter oceani]